MFSFIPRARLCAAVLLAAAGAFASSASAGSDTPAPADPAAMDASAAEPAATDTPPATEPAAADAPAAGPAAWELRSLRNPLPDMGELPPPTVPEVFDGTYPGAHPFTIVPRVGTPALPLHPCVMCHDLRKPDPTVRIFKVAPPPDGAPHAGVLRHGKGRMWCLDCHYMNDRQWLRTLDDKKLAFDDAPQQCGQCHSARYRDWVFGGHGKRVAGWTGDRQLYSCVHCHDPHVPVLPARAPRKPPPVRAGLKPMVRTHAAAPAQGRAPTPALASGISDGKEARP